MTAYTIVGTGEINASVSTNYSPTGIPTSADTVTFAANQRLVIPNGFTFDAVVVPAAGTSASLRSGFIIEGGGTRILREDETWGAWNILEFRGTTGTATLDLNGFDIYYSVQTGTNVNNYITSNNQVAVRIISSGGLSYISQAALTASVGFIDLNNFYVSNVCLLFGGRFYAGHHTRFRKGVFFNAGRWELSQYSHRADDFIIDRVLYNGTCQNPTFESPQNKIINLRAQNGEATGTVSTNRYINDLVVLSSGVTSPLFRMDHCPSNITVDGFYTNTFQQISNNDTDWTNVFIYNNSIGSLGASRKWVNTYAAVKLNNPHTAENVVTFEDGVIESLYGATGSQNDGADHFMSGSTTANKFVRRTLVIDTYGGALLNTVGTSGGATGTWLLEKCTYVIDCRDATYGQLIRNENSGYFAAGASVTVQSNILHARSNPSGATSIRAVNMESGPATGQIDVLRNNCLSIPSADMSQVYFRADAGTDDVFVNPNFYDQNRGIESWGAQYGYSTYEETCTKLMYGVVGYDSDNPTLPLNDGFLTGRTVNTVLDWVRYGFRPTNSAISTAAHDGSTIGAFDYLALSVILDSAPADIRVTESRTARVTVPATALTTANVSVKVNDVGNTAIVPTSVTNVSGLTYDVTFQVANSYAGLPYHPTGYPIIISTPDGSVTSGNIPFLPVTGYDYVNPTSVTGDLTVLSGTLNVGDQLEWDTLSGAVSVTEECLILYTGSDPDGISFNIRAWDDTDETWGDYALQTFETTPAQYSIFGAGGVLGSGDATLKVTFSRTSSGGVSTSGASKLKSTFSRVMSGITSILGAAKSSITKRVLPDTSAAVLSGSARSQLVIGAVTYVIRGSGGVNSSGSAKSGKFTGYIIKAIGGVLSSGSALVLRGYRILANGAVSLSGKAKQLSSRGILGNGGVVVSGGSVQGSSLDYTVSVDRLASSGELGFSIFRTLKKKTMTIKDPDNVLDYGWDFTPELAKIKDTIQTVTVITLGGISSSRIAHDDYKVSAFISGGAIGTEASATFRITTSGGRTIDKTLYFTIQQQ